MNSIPTVEDFLLQFENKHPRLKAEVSTEVDKDIFYSSAQGAMVTIDVMIEFAKLHVEAAIKTCIEEAPSGSSTDTVSYEDVVKALKDCYPLSNIK